MESALAIWSDTRKPALAVTLAMLANGIASSMISSTLLFIMLYTGWIVTAIWCCTDNVKVTGYGVMARWLTVA